MTGDAATGSVTSGDAIAGGMAASRLPPGVAVRVAAIDCGTNTIRLLIAEGVPGEGTWKEIHRETRTVRLGEGVDATGALTTSALDRAWSTLAHYASVVRASEVLDLRVAATSALRDTRNPEAFVALVRSVLGTGVDILTGDQEAAIGFRGTVSALTPGPGRVLTVDIGGGSTEIVLGRRPVVDATGRPAAGVVEAAASIDIGAVRLTERMLAGDPPSRTEIERSRSHCAATISSAMRDWPAALLAEVDTVIGVAGTALTVAAGAQRRSRLDPAQLDGAVLPYPDVHRTCENLLHANRSHRAMLGYVLPGRVDVIGGGALVLSQVLQEVERRTPVRQLTISVADILDGLVQSVFDRVS